MQLNRLCTAFIFISEIWDLHSNHKSAYFEILLSALNKQTTVFLVVMFN